MGKLRHGHTAGKPSARVLLLFPVLILRQDSAAETTFPRLCSKVQTTAINDPTAAPPFRRLLPNTSAVVPLPNTRDRAHQAAGTGVGGDRDAGGRGASRPGGQPLPELFSQEGHQRGEEAETDVSAGQQDLRRPRRAGRVRQHRLHGLLGKGLRVRVRITAMAMAFLHTPAALLVGNAVGSHTILDAIGCPMKRGNLGQGFSETGVE